MLNLDGRLFVERLGQGMEVLANLEAGAAEIIIGTVAHALQTQTDTDHPIISGELPIGGHRFEGLLPPVVSAPSFTIRRRASQLIPMDDYIRDGIMTPAQASAIREGIAGRLNIVICGETGSGKTTLANAVIAEVVATSPAARHHSA
jgi:Flp pilus assembly CpaF family ATPase